jgi:hypothetical protein
VGLLDDGVDMSALLDLAQAAQLRHGHPNNRLVLVLLLVVITVAVRR